MNLTNTLNFFKNSRVLVVLLCCLSLFSFYGCDKNDDQADENLRIKEQQERQLAADTLIIKDYIADHNISNVMRSPYKSGIFYTVQTPGTGDSAAVGKTVVTHYNLINLEGDTLDTSRKPRPNETAIVPYSFILGDFRSQNAPIVGYQESVALMRVGERATFFLPSGLAYGTQGRGTTIPANTVLIFDIELLQVK